MSPRTGRRSGDAGTRGAILAAARRRFGDHGFAGATIRMIAADAGVDPALVLHYFGNKADLFAAAVDMPITLSQPLASLTAGDPATLGERILAFVTRVWDDPEGRAAWLGLLRSAVADEGQARMLREFLTSTLFGPLAGVLAGPDAELRVALVASHVVGVGMARYVVRLEPLASASTDDLVAMVAPVLQHHLTGDVGASAGRGSA